MNKTYRIRFGLSHSDNRKSKACGEYHRTIENRKWVGCLAILLLLTGWLRTVAAQQPTGKIFRIGILDNSTASSMAVRLEAFRQELSKLGWIEGKSIAI